MGFLKIVRDRLDDLIEYLNASPMGRHLSEEVCELFKSDDPIKRAAAVFYCCNFQGQPVATRYPSWLKPRIVSRGNIAHGVGRLENRMNKLRGVVSVLRQIYFENRPASKILELYSKTQDYMYREGDINLLLRSGKRVYQTGAETPRQDVYTASAFYLSITLNPSAGLYHKGVGLTDETTPLQS